MGPGLPHEPRTTYGSRLAHPSAQGLLGWLKSMRETFELKWTVLSVYRDCGVSEGFRCQRGTIRDGLASLEG